MTDGDLKIEDKDKEIEYWRIEYNKARDENHLQSVYIEMLKDTIVRLSMKLTGVEEK